MGEYADMILEGSLCQHCGEYLDNAYGFAQTCPGCALKERKDEEKKPKKKKK